MPAPIEIPLRDRDGALVGVALVDIEDASLAQHRWCLRPDGYAVRRKEGRIVRLHREVLGLQHGSPLVADHINGDTLDNRRSNLRVCTRAQNAQNRAPMGKTSPHRGVYWHAAKGKWQASITVRYRSIYLGRFDSELEAAAAAEQARAAWFTHNNESRAAK